jgi:hypothetical protein
MAKSEIVFAVHYQTLDTGAREAHVIPHRNVHAITPDCWCKPVQPDLPYEEQRRLAEEGLIVWLHVFYQPKGENGHGI